MLICSFALRLQLYVYAQVARHNAKVPCFINVDEVVREIVEVAQGQHWVYKALLRAMLK